MYVRTLLDVGRTNNQTESFNNRFSRLISHQQVWIWILIKKNTLEVVSDETKIYQRLLETIPPNKKK